MHYVGPSNDLLLRLNMIWVLFWNQFLPRNHRESMKLVWVFVEPAAQLALLITLFSLIGRTPAYGNSFAIFLLTGIAIITFFSRTSSAVAMSMNAVKGGNRLPSIGIFSEPIAITLFNAFVSSIYISILMWGISVYQHQAAAPRNWDYVFLLCGQIMLLAFGFGLIKGYCQRFVPFMNRIFTIFLRVLLFISGVFYVPSFMPPQFRELLAYNPVLQSVELFRLGIYGFDYPTIVFSPLYLASCTFGFVAVGLTLCWKERRRLVE